MEGNFQEIHTAPHHRPLAMTAAGIGRLPGAYFFTVPEGERTFPADGVNASPQRVFCAAAKPNLDEAACALDNTCEKCIQEEIFKNQAGNAATAIAVTHRLSALRNCDGIIVMDRGLTVQRGAFKTLEGGPGSGLGIGKWGRTRGFFAKGLSIRPCLCYNYAILTHAGVAA